MNSDMVSFDNASQLCKCKMNEFIFHWLFRPTVLVFEAVTFVQRQFIFICLVNNKVMDDNASLDDAESQRIELNLMCRSSSVEKN